MTVLRIELLDPRAKALLEDLAKMDLIKIQDIDSTQERFAKLLDKFRSKKDTPSLEEITEEVEAVRAARNKQNG